MQKGFTLAELLIALAILGVIATFTIPKVLTANQNGQYKSIAKEAAAAVSQALIAYKADNAVTASTSLMDLTPYLNYVNVITTSFEVDHKPGFGTVSCADLGCLRLHNGAVLWYDDSDGYAVFGGTNATNAMMFLVDPNGKSSVPANSPDKSVEFALYANGAITSRANFRPNTTTQAGNVGGAVPAEEPTWFNWN
ncbi:MAG: type II secretion system protein [Vampirovibrionales bacterium]|nr:type II secretion system protein [Vampirovibrionales bacterium]